MIKTFFNALSLQGRMGRRTYTRNVILFFVICVLITIDPICHNSAFINRTHYTLCQSHNILKIILLWLNLWWFFVSHVKRCHDLNRPGKYLLNFKSNVTLFKDTGTDGPNHYGLPPAH